MNSQLLPEQMQKEIYIFNLHPFAYADPSWYSDGHLASALLPWLHLRHVQQIISSDLLRELRLSKESFITDFRNPLFLLALLGDWVTITKLVGAALSWQQLRTSVRREQVLICQKILGEDLYYYVLTRAPYFFPHVRSMPLPAGEDNLLQTFLRRGIKACRVLFRAKPAGHNIWSRILLKLPRRLAEDNREASSYQLNQIDNFPKMMKEVFPQWHPFQ